MEQLQDSVVGKVAGRLVKATVLSGKARPHVPMNRDGWGFAAVDKASDQLALSTESFMIDFQGNSCEPPPVPLETYSDMYRSGGTHHACVDAKVSDVVGQGFAIRPRAQLFPLAGDTPKDFKPDPKNQKKIHDFIDIPMNTTGVSFLDILCDVYRDQEALGQGYIEFFRGGDRSEVAEMYYIPSVSVRIAKGGPRNGFFQRMGLRYKYFAQYDGVRRIKYIRLDGRRVEMPVEDAQRRRGKASHFLAMNPRELGQERAAYSIGTKAAISDLTKIPEDGSGVVRANELMMFRHGTTNLTSYGEPDIYSAMADYNVEQSVRDYAVAYFATATIPRIVMAITGDATVSEEVMEKIEDWISNQSPIEVLQQSLLIELPEEVTLKIEELSQAQLSDDTGLIDLRDHSARYQAAAHRVPLSALPMQVGSNRAEISEDNARYVGSVVRPAQRKIEQKLNWLFRNETGVLDWVIDLDVPDLLDMETKYNIWAVGAQRGWLSINEIRGFLSMPPVDGGDFPFVLVPGQGTVPIANLEEIANKMLSGAKRGDLMGTGNEKTPPKGTLPKAAAETLLAGMAEPDAAVALMLPFYDDELPGMNAKEMEIVAKAVEELTVNKDDVAEAFKIISKQ